MSEWQPIETAPRDGRSILLWCNFHDSGGLECAVAWWDNKDHKFPWVNDYTGYSDRIVTHWMPLPNPPTPPNAHPSEP